MLQQHCMIKKQFFFVMVRVLTAGVLQVLDEDGSGEVDRAEFEKFWEMF
jgi:hypothetical protein